MRLAWVVPLGGQLDLLAGWLEPIVERPGLEAVPADRLHVLLLEVEGDADAAPVDVEPFDALVGPVRITDEGVVGEVIPVEPFPALRERLGGTGPFAPRVVFARATGGAAFEQIEANACDAVLVRQAALVDLDAA